MKICLIGCHSDNPDEAMKRITLELYKELSKRNQVLLVEPRKMFRKDFWRRIHSFSPDIFHYTSGPTIRSLLFLKIAKWFSHTDPKTVVSATRPYFSRFSLPLIPLLKPDLILTQSQKFEKYFQKYGCTVSFLPNGVDVAKFSLSSESERQHFRKKYQIPIEKFVVLHVGHVKKNRNLEILAEIQRFDGVQVVIVGGTSMAIDVRVKHLLEKSGCIVWRRYFENIEEIYKMADCFVFPTQDLEEDKLPRHYHQVGAVDLPLSILEAMSCNLPILSTKFGALPRLFQTGHGFFYFQSKQDLFQKLELVKQGLNVETWEMVKKLRWTKIATEMEREYRTLISDGFQKNHNYTRLICIVGIDGSGKTTLANLLAAQWRRRCPTVRYIHSYHEAILLKPMKILAKLVLMEGTDEFGDYTHYRKTKVAASVRHPFLSRLYGILWMIDYFVQAFFTVGVPRILRRKLVVDRYIYDAALNASLTMNGFPETSYRFIDLFFKVNPRPNIVFLIDLPVEVAFARKNDIQSVEYLRERRNMYLAMAKRYGFHILDGLAKPEDLLSEVFAEYSKMEWKPFSL